MPDLLDRYRWAIAALLAAPLLVALGFLLSDRLDDDPPPLDITLPAGDLRVYVTGAVQAPGVYPLSDGDRWIDALEAAGGPLDDADLAAVDLARRARDEDTVAIPYLGDTGVASASLGPLIDLNAASADQLQTLPGIGEVRAARIVRSRDEDGRFASIDELLERELIPQSVFEDIAELVTVGP